MTTPTQINGNLAKLEKNWRRVASTHTLQDLLDADTPLHVHGKINKKILFYGIALVSGGILVIILGIVAFGARWIPLPPPSSPYHQLINIMQQDRYYHLLVPVTVPVTIITVFINWFSMKLFKHNS